MAEKGSRHGVARPRVCASAVARACSHVRITAAWFAPNAPFVCPRPFDRGFSSCRPSRRPASCLFKSLAHLFHSHALLSLGTLHTIPAFSPSRWSCLVAGVDGGGNVTLAPAAQGGSRAPVALPMPPPPPAAPAAAAGVGAGPLLGGGDDAEERARRKQVGIQGRPRTLRWVVLC
jgi:hypothetical protein